MEDSLIMLLLWTIVPITITGALLYTMFSVSQSMRMRAEAAILEANISVKSLQFTMGELDETNQPEEDEK
jgi:hypothetical protein